MNIYETMFDNMILLNDIKKRYNRGYQTTMLCCGGTNEGKTKFMLMVYFLINKIILKKRNIEIKPYFQVKEFAKNISKLVNEQIFFDESGAGGLDVREWNSKDNKLLSYILQTQRVQKNFYYIILPHKRLITHTHLVLFDYYVIVKDDEDKGRCAYIYKIITRHLATNDYEDYISFKLIQKLEIPDYMNDSRLKEMKEFILNYEKIELQKKKEIALQIEKMANEEIKKNKSIFSLNDF